jgi:DNA-binding beta-propeller fold protein YncE
MLMRDATPGELLEVGMRALLVVSIVTITTLAQTPRTALRAVGSIALPGVDGRIDHLAVDVQGGRLFVAALGNNTVEVVDLNAGKVAKSVKGFDEPQGIRYLPESRGFAVANGGNGATVFLDGATFAITKTVKLSGDADNVRYDAKTRRVFVGYGNGALSILDAMGNGLGEIRLDGHPESFQLETNGPRIFVNVPSSRQIAVIDRDKQSVIAKWSVTQASSNYPMALDEVNHRLFVGCRSPARLLVFDTGTGSFVTSAEIVGDTDDLFYDAAKRRIYVSGGEGYITVLEQQDADHYRLLQKLPTVTGARTSLFVPEVGRLFLAVPHRGAQRAEIGIFAVSD